MKPTTILIIAVVLIALTVPVLGSTLHGYTRADGDSFMAGGVSGEYRHKNDTFIERTARYYNLDLDNQAIGGTNTTELLGNLYQNLSIPSPYDSHILNIGFNDLQVVWLRDEPTKYDTPNETANRITAMVAFLRLADIADLRNASPVYTGAWSPSNKGVYRKVVLRSNTTGDTVEFPHEGNVSLSLITYSRTATVDIRIDSVSVAQPTLICPRTSGCPAGFEFRNVGDGTHTVTIENIAGVFAVDWVGTPRTSPDTPFILVNGITQKPNLDPGYDECVDYTNLLLRENIAVQFDERVVFADQSSYDAEKYPFVGPGNDVTHPNNFGHAWIADNIRRAL